MSTNSKRKLVAEVQTSSQMLWPPDVRVVPRDGAVMLELEAPGVWQSFVKLSSRAQVEKLREDLLFALSQAWPRDGEK